MSHFLPDHWLGLLPQLGAGVQARVVGISAQGAAWQDLSPLRRACWHQAPWPAPSQGFSAPGLKSLVDALALQPGQAIRWILAPSLMRHWLQIPPAHTASLAELHAVAQARAMQLFGPGAMDPSIADADWTVAADWHATRPFLCAGVATRLQRALHQATGSAPAVFSLLVLALSQFQSQFPRHGWLAIALAGEVHVMQVDRGRASRLRSVRVGLDATPSQVESLALLEWQREKLRAQSRDTDLHWLNLSPTPVLQSSSAALKPIRYRLEVHASAEGSATLDTGPLNEAQQAAWCGEALFWAKIA